MAFYRINKGKEENLPSAMSEGSLYFCIDTGNLFVDHKNTSNTLVRTKVSGKYAEKLRYAKDGSTVEIDPSTILTDSNYETKIGTATQSKSGLISTEDKIKLDGIEAEANKYILPAATSSALGGIIAETATTDDIQAVRIGADNKLVTAKNVLCVNLTVSVSSDYNPTITADKTYAEIVAAYNAGKYVYVLIPLEDSVYCSFPLTEYRSSSNIIFFSNAIAEMSKYYYVFTCTSDGTTDTWNIDPVEYATRDSLNNLVKNITISGKTITITKYNGSTSTITTQDTTYSVFTGATSSAAGSRGLVPAPASGKQDYFLKADGTWAEAKTTVDTELSTTSTNPVQNKVITKYINPLYDALVFDSNNNLTGINIKDEVTGYRYTITMHDGTLATTSAIASIQITTNPTKMTYTAGEYIDTTGMVVTGTCDDGTSKEITNFACTNYVTTDNPAFTISANGVSIDLPVTVTAFDPAVVLIDFTYTDNGDGTYTIIDWKETYNGEPSTEMIVPNNAYIIL